MAERSSAPSRAHSPEFALLGFLYKQANHGYTLHQLLVTELGQVWHVSQSQTYAILRRLENQGWISSSTIEQEKLPSRQLLSLTPAGKERFQKWLRTPSGSSVRAIRLEFITRIYFAQKLFPRRLEKLFSEQAAEVKAALTRLEGALKTIPPEQTFNRMGMELRINQLHSICDWLDESRASLLATTSKKEK